MYSRISSASLSSSRRPSSRQSKQTRPAPAYAATAPLDGSASCSQRFDVCCADVHDDAVRGVRHANVHPLGAAERAAALCGHVRAHAPVVMEVLPPTLFSQFLCGQQELCFAAPRGPAADHGDDHPRAHDQRLPLHASPRTCFLFPII